MCAHVCMRNLMHFLSIWQICEEPNAIMTMRKMLRLQHRAIETEHAEIAHLHKIIESVHKMIESKDKKINAIQVGADSITDLLTLHGFTQRCGYNRILHECAVRTASFL